MRVLIADDNAIMRKIVHTNLRHSIDTAVVEEVSDGKQVIAKLNENTFDLLFLDINMPHIDGIEVLRYIKDNLIKGLNIIIISGELSDKNIEKLKEFSIKYIVEKPFDTNSFNKVIKEFLNDHE
jgi:two-component system chemotaxis response regulator CheY